MHTDQSPGEKLYLKISIYLSRYTNQIFFVIRRTQQEQLHYCDRLRHKQTNLILERPHARSDHEDARTTRRPTGSTNDPPQFDAPESARYRFGRM